MELVKLDEILPNPYQIQKEIDENSAKSVAAFYNEWSVTDPLPLIVFEKQYYTITPHKHLAIIKALGYKEYPCYILFEPTKYFFIQESIVRDIRENELNPIDIAQQIKILKESLSITINRLETTLWMQGEDIEKFLFLLNLSPESQEAVHDGRMSPEEAVFLHDRSLSNTKSKHDQRSKSKKKKKHKNVIKMDTTHFKL